MRLDLQEWGLYARNPVLQGSQVSIACALEKIVGVQFHPHLNLDFAEEQRGNCVLMGLSLLRYSGSYDSQVLQVYSSGTALEYPAIRVLGHDVPFRTIYLAPPHKFKAMKKMLEEMLQPVRA